MPTAPPPKAVSANPVAKPRLSGNQRMSMLTGVTYLFQGISATAVMRCLSEQSDPHSEYWDCQCSQRQRDPGTPRAIDISGTVHHGQGSVSPVDV